ncbi:MAG: hypothetical protein FJ110_10965 [Deltaproteobacteria bacterium]|nr:hypothetical protein [Deltaproteobacteria bacterium]
MDGNVADSNLENRLSAMEPFLPNFNMIWDLRILLKSSQQRLEKLKKAPARDSTSIELERAIVRGTNKEIQRREKEALCPEKIFR